ncbi:MAG: excinuclease ABC subunit UvrC [Bacteroidota bacterium]
MENTLENKLKEIIKALPFNPGIYQYFDSEEKIIYIGKAKNLKKRVSSYFNRDNHDSRKTALLVKNICDIKFIIVESELDALLLENTLIKKYQPKYNINLKDDKTYPWICVKNEDFPRVFATRNLIKDGSHYFGPYAMPKIMYTVLDLIKDLYPLRTCNYTLSRENIEKHKYKVCLEYHIGNCKGACEGHQSKTEYDIGIENIKDILRGNTSAVLRMLKALMQDNAEKFEFEKAQALKLKIEELERFKSKSTVVSPTISDVDVFSIKTDEDFAFINFLKVMEGAIVQGHTIELKKKLDETDEELLLFGITELRTRFESFSKEIIVPFKLSIELPDINFIVPQRGDKKQLLELSLRNVDYYRKEKQKQSDLIDPDRHTNRIMAQLKKDLRLTEEPRHIECFDNSNFQGAFPVAAMTVFKDGKPSKRDYRHFNIKTVEGPNDFASMEEVIYRRYKRLQDEDLPLPQLIVIDGGKGQLSSALISLEKLGLRGKIGIIGIAKKLEEIYFPGDAYPLYIDKKSESLRIIQHIRDEAHRFGITHHRAQRAKGTIKTELNDIKGISGISATKLLKKFKSVLNIAKAEMPELVEEIGEAKAKLVFDYFNKKQD